MLIPWNFDPVLFTFGPLAVRWYGLLFVGAFLFGQLMAANIFKREGHPPEQAESLMMYALLGTIIGARLGHCLFYDPSYYLSNPLAILKIWEGGLASHGGAVGLLLGLWLGLKRITPTTPFFWLVDRATLPAAFGAIFVRVGNFLNSEIVGNPTDGQWGVIFQRVDTLPRHPVQLYEAAAYLVVFLILYITYQQRGKNTPQGLLFGLFLFLVFSARFVIEFFKTAQSAYDVTHLLSTGQYLSLPFVALGFVFLIRSNTYRTK